MGSYDDTLITLDTELFTVELPTPVATTPSICRDVKGHSLISAGSEGSYPYRTYSMYIQLHKLILDYLMLNGPC